MSDDLINAIHANDINKIKKLVVAGADINQENKHGQRPLEYAVFLGKIDMVRLFVKELGVDINKENKYGRTPLEQAISSDKIDMVRLLVKELGVDINQENKYRQTPVMIAVSSDKIDMVRLLVKELGVDINKENKYGPTPLEQAVFSGKIDMVRLLVELGADINKENKYDVIPLEQAIEQVIFFGKIDMLRLLVELGADINKENKYGRTPLQLAIENNYIDMVRLLVELGADVNKENKYGVTPLQLAISSGKIDIVRLLVKELGADVNFKNKYGKAYYLYARCKPEILKILKDAGAIVEDFKENEFLYLTHVTNSDNFFKMLESGKIYSNVDMWYKSSHISGLSSRVWKPSSGATQYPGVYMTLINNELVGEQIRLLYEDRPICLVFCISLLNREDFHYNDDDNNGYITSKLTSFNISDVKNSIKNKCIIKQNEVIFHHSVSLKYLREIWVYDEETYNKVKNILEKFSINLPVQITNNYLDEPKTCNKPIKNLSSNYCYFPVMYGDGDEDEEHYLQFAKKLGKECGLTDIDDIDDPEMIEELLTKQILPADITIEGVKEYLKSKGVSDDTIDNLSESQLNELKYMNLVGLNFIRNYSRFDGGKGKRKKSVRKKSKSKRKKSVRKKSKSSKKSKRKKSDRKKSKSKKSKRKSIRKKSKSKRSKSKKSGKKKSRSKRKKSARK